MRSTATGKTFYSFAFDGTFNKENIVCGPEDTKTQRRLLSYRWGGHPGDSKDPRINPHLSFFLPITGCKGKLAPTVHEK
jgi:hypothetical protein